jgi:hypothetical protein
MKQKIGVNMTEANVEMVHLQRTITEASQQAIHFRTGIRTTIISYTSIEENCSQYKQGRYSKGSFSECNCRSNATDNPLPIWN